MASNKVSPNKHNLVQDTKLTSGKKLYLDGGGDTYSLEMVNLNLIYIDSTEDGEGVRYTYFT